MLSIRVAAYLRLIQVANKYSSVFIQSVVNLLSTHCIISNYFSLIYFYFIEFKCRQMKCSTTIFSIVFSIIQLTTDKDDSFIYNIKLKTS